ncbi:protein phosphatase 1 regulatory subunit 1B-like isoform 2-T2 [Clarias gariepinus]|uniref:protein phosphatase 1 regulatory subunit 1B-like isoform X2 n=1 Tax=Clarias gariepinus TaxID=13013 RepID=UPI00234C32CF|nr:protein phosphatase 1 regulatory subunit 1B-like isoform X2 [Clarias gariepinus]
MEGEIKEGRKIQFSVPSAGPIQLDPRQVEMIRRRRPTPATLFRMTDHPSPDEEHPSMLLFACENGVSKANNADTNVYQPPSLQAVQKMAQAHIKTSETPSLESSDSEEVSLDAPGDPPNEIKLECPSCSGGSAKEEKGKVDAENLRAESMKNGESGGKGDE